MGNIDTLFEVYTVKTFPKVLSAVQGYHADKEDSRYKSLVETLTPISNAKSRDVVSPLRVEGGDVEDVVSVPALMKFFAGYMTKVNEIKANIAGGKSLNAASSTGSSKAQKKRNRRKNKAKAKAEEKKKLEAELSAGRVAAAEAAERLAEVKRRAALARAEATLRAEQEDAMKSTLDRMQEDDDAGGVSGSDVTMSGSGASGVVEEEEEVEWVREEVNMGGFEEVFASFMEPKDVVDRKRVIREDHEAEAKERKALAEAEKAEKKRLEAEARKEAAGGESSESSDSDSDSDVDSDVDEDGFKLLSRKELKRRFVLTPMQLKMQVQNPQNVEKYDTFAPNPLLQVHLKGISGAPDIPEAWTLKRKYLSAKRGEDKKVYTLPKCILETGISDLRNVSIQKEAESTMKQKSRGKVRPKMDSLSIDPQVLQDAFFKYNTKPKFTRAGDFYYENRENEVDHESMVPGRLSLTLQLALDMVDPSCFDEEGRLRPEAVKKPAPPPFLRKMQQYGPPRGYAGILVPGVNAPLPSGASYGYGNGEWGKPPITEQGYPVYSADVYAEPGSGGSGFTRTGRAAGAVGENLIGTLDPDFVVKSMAAGEVKPPVGMWGQPRKSGAAEEEEEVEDLDIEMGDAGLQKDSSSLEGNPPNASAVNISTAGGMETPIPLRKADNRPKDLFTVIKEVDAGVDLSGAIATGGRRYMMPGVAHHGEPDSAAQPPPPGSLPPPPPPPLDGNLRNRGEAAGAPPQPKRYM